MISSITTSIFKHAVAGVIALILVCGGDFCWTGSQDGASCPSIDASGYICSDVAVSNELLAACNSPDGDVNHANGGVCNCICHVPVILPTPVLMSMGGNRVVRVLHPHSSTMPASIVSDIDLPPIIG